LFIVFFNKRKKLFLILQTINQLVLKIIVTIITIMGIITTIIIIMMNIIKMANITAGKKEKEKKIREIIKNNFCFVIRNLLNEGNDIELR